MYHMCIRYLQEHIPTEAKRREEDIIEDEQMSLSNEGRELRTQQQCDKSTQGGKIMTSEVKEILQHTMQLPRHLRAYLAEMLLESLDVEEDFPLQEEWMQEIITRCREIDEGRVELIEAEQGLAQLRHQVILA